MSPVPRGAYQSDRHTMEIYDPGEMAPTTLVHETGHAFDYANPKLSQAFKDEAGWNAYGNPLALAEHLHDHEEGAVEDLVARLEAERKNPAMRNRTGASLDDKAYMPDQYSPEGYTEREAGAIPTPAGSEVMLGSQADEWGYARSGGPLEHFAEQYRLSILDPFTLYTDLMDRPATSGASEATRTSLADQWRVMREQVFGVTPARVEEMAAGVGDVERFKEQARRCATQPQLEALRSLYLSGQDVRPEHVEQASATLAALPEAQRAAFLADARNCVTPSQLEDIRRSYAEGQRRDRKWVRP